MEETNRARQEGPSQRAEPRGRKALRQAAVILLLSAILSFTTNRLRPDSLALVSDWSAETQLTLESGESLIIPLKEAERLFRAGAAVFVDARSCEVYEQGHIRGARCLPWQGVEKFSDEMLSDLSRDTVIIAYCDGEGCSLSKELALELLFRGYEQVKVLVNGWTLWRENSLPIDTGPPMSVEVPASGSAGSKS